MHISTESGTLVVSELLTGQPAPSNGTRLYVTFRSMSTSLPHFSCLKKLFLGAVRLVATLPQSLKSLLTKCMTNQFIGCPE